MKILAIVEHSPWGSSLPVTALRLLRSLSRNGVAVDTVYFRGDGVYNAQAGRGSDHGTPALADAWRDLARDCGARLLVCSSASRRRLDSAPGSGFPDGDVDFREAGLPEVIERMAACDRVVSF